MHQSLGIMDYNCSSSGRTIPSFGDDRMQVTSEDTPERICFNFAGFASVFPFIPATIALDDPRKISPSSSKKGFNPTSSCSVDDEVAPCRTAPQRKLEQQHSSNTTSTTASSICDDPMMEPLVTDKQELLVLYDDHDSCGQPTTRKLKSSKKRTSRRPHANKNSTKNKRSASTANLPVVSSKLKRHFIDDFPKIEWSDDEDDDDEQQRPPAVFKSSKSLTAIDGCMQISSSSCLTNFLAPPKQNRERMMMLRSMSFRSHLGSLHILQGPVC